MLPRLAFRWMPAEGTHELGGQCDSRQTSTTRGVSLNLVIPAPSKRYEDARMSRLLRKARTGATGRLRTMRLRLTAETDISNETPHAARVNPVPTHRSRPVGGAILPAGRRHGLEANLRVSAH